MHHVNACLKGPAYRNTAIQCTCRIGYWSKNAANLKGLYQKGRTKKATNLKGRKPKQTNI